MFLNRIRGKKSGVLLYGITPPKAQTAPEKVAEMAEKSLNILCSLDIDALVVYDVQDESARTSEERPFPYQRAGSVRLRKSVFEIPVNPKNHLPAGGKIQQRRIKRLAAWS